MKNNIKTSADIAEQQLEQMGKDLLDGKCDLKIAKEFHNNVGKRVSVANGQAKQNERGHTIAIPFYGISIEMEKDLRKVNKKK